MDTSEHHLTVADVADADELCLTVIHAGAGMEAEIEVPHVVELPVPVHSLNGGELVMTTGVVLGGNAESWAQLFTVLEEGGAAGLVIGLGPEPALRRVPDFVPELGAQHDLPVLAAPEQTPLTKITRAVIDGRTEFERATLQGSFALQVKLTGIVARGGGIDELIRQWQESTGEGVLVLDRVMRVLAKTSAASVSLSETTAESLRQNPPALGEESRPNAGGKTVAITAFAGDTTMRGYLARVDSGKTKARLSVPTLRSLLALELERRWYLNEPDRRRRAQNVTRLLSAEDDGRATALLKGLGIDAGLLWGVVIETATKKRAEVILDDLAVVLGTPLVRHKDRVVECLTVNDPLRVLSDYAMPEPVGIGTAVTPGGTALTLRQARAAMETSRRAGMPVTFIDGAAHDFLLQVADTSYLDAFADAVLAPIEAIDSGAAVLETLHMWLAERRSIETCAVRMGIHRHTVRNRLHRITQAIGRDLDSVDTQTELWLALKARGFGEK